MAKDLTTGKITPQLVKFTIPLVLGNLFQLTYNAVDSIIVGRFVGKEALAAGNCPAGKARNSGNCQFHGSCCCGSVCGC